MFVHPGLKNIAMFISYTMEQINEETTASKSKLGNELTSTPIRPTMTYEHKLAYWQYSQLNHFTQQ